MIPGHCHGQAWEAASWEGFLAYCETSGQEKTAFSALKVAFIPTLGSGFGKQGSLWNCSGKSVRRNKVQRTNATCKRHGLSAADLSGCLSGNQCYSCYSMAEERRRLGTAVQPGAPSSHLVRLREGNAAPEPRKRSQKSQRRNTTNKENISPEPIIGKTEKDFFSMQRNNYK